MSGIFVLAVILGYIANYVTFESDISSMNYVSPPVLAAQNKLNRINKFALRSIYLVSEGKTLDQALVNDEKLNDTIESLKQKNIVYQVFRGFGAHYFRFTPER